MTTAPSDVTGDLIEIDGIMHYRIEGVEQLAPFLMSVLSESDLWMFASSTGNLTAGRRDADHAILPYETEDRIHRSAGTSGPVTLLTRRTDTGIESWQPFGPIVEPGVTRALSKSVLGNRLVLDEVNERWGVRFRTVWAPSARFGWVRTSELIDEAGREHSLEVIDGLVDVMPAGVDAHTEQVTSNLVDAYKRSETGRWGTAAIFTLESLITDRAEPAEALTATMVWSAGFPASVVDLDERCLHPSPGQLRDMSPSTLLTGRRGSYLLRGSIDLAAGETRSWLITADTAMDRVDVERRLDTLETDGREKVAADIEAGSHRLRKAIELVDGIQHSGDPVADAHHLSNTMFNIMRGGVFSHGYRIPLDDFRRFVRVWNTPAYERHSAALEALRDGIDEDGLRDFAQNTGDPDVIRLVHEYLPLSFSRRHGDPSRPWNKFSIRVRDERGDDLLAYEGNWRDIFQNWEALLLSFPAFHLNIVAKFLNASTLDGHNPYRISDQGIDWEVPDPEDPWSNIGYWGDHQIVYLLRLLESWERVEPGGVDGWLERRIFTYADVPYVLADYHDMVEDPRDTITFDIDKEREVAERVAAIGADGRLIHTDDGAMLRVTMLEKLLVPALAKMTAYVPGAGIWMNTQRPEWNDANNALAGFGLSMVTLQYLYRYLGFVLGVLGRQTSSTEMSRSVAEWMSELTSVLETNSDPDQVTTPEGRRRMMDGLGAAGTEYRRRVGETVPGDVADVGTEEIAHFIRLARTHLAATIRSSRRDDGLYHSYNLISFPDPSTAVVEHLDEMLEGQVAAISGGLLTPEDVADVVDRLFTSSLYREDQASFLLYPNVTLGSFLDRNCVDGSVLDEHPFLAGLVGDSPTAAFRPGPDGMLHFNAAFTNADALRSALDGTGLSEDHVALVVDLYETEFDHHAFTGRSRAMYGYEGLGSIYWHMVGKLLVAVQESHRTAAEQGASAETLERLRDAYRRIRDGLGFRKDPLDYGAFPTDCYSHTPAHAGAQQPGMTGQVKEEVITRFGEVGLRFDRGHVAVGTPLIPDTELFGDSRFRATVCGTPLELVPGSEANVEVEWSNGESLVRQGDSLTAAESSEIFQRTGSIRTIRFTLPTDREDTR